MCSGCSRGISPSPRYAGQYVNGAAGVSPPHLSVHGHGDMYVHVCVYIYMCVYMCIYMYMSICMCMLKKKKKTKECRCSWGISSSPKCVHVCMYYMYDMNEYIRQAKPSSSHVSSAPADHTPMSHPTTSQTQ